MQRAISDRSVMLLVKLARTYPSNSTSIPVMSPMPTKGNKRYQRRATSLSLQPTANPLSPMFKRLASEMVLADKKALRAQRCARCKT